MTRTRSVLAAILALAWLAGCQQSARSTATSAPGPVITAASPVTGAAATGTPLAPGAAPSVTPTQEAYAPLTIASMRAKQYPGSDIALVQTLPPGANYNRYIASYRSDGLTLFALLTVPAGQKPDGGWPVMLLNHGYIPPAEYSTEQSYARVVALLAEAGFIVFKPDYRGNGNSPGIASQPYISPDYVSDSLNALASIRRYPDANPDRVGIWGHSMGGNITMHELVIDHDFKAAVLMAGVVGSYGDLINWWKARVASGVLTTQNDLRTNDLVDQMVALHGTPDSNPAFWNPIDPTQYVSDVSVPVLIQVGTADTVVPPSFSEEFAARLRSVGKSANLHVYPGADHNLSPDTAAAVEEAIAFFNQNLK